MNLTYEQKITAYSKALVVDDNGTAVAVALEARARGATPERASACLLSAGMIRTREHEATTADQFAQVEAEVERHHEALVAELAL